MRAVLLYAALVSLCMGQDLAEPEFAGVFFRLDAGKLVPLERQPVNKFHAGFGGKMSGEFPGGKASIRFRTGEPLEFIVRQGIADGDPAGTYHLKKLTADKKKRRYTIMNVERTSLFSATAISGVGLDDVTVTFSRYGTASLKMAVPNLATGEYALGLTFGGQGQAMFCFGVD